MRRGRGTQGRGVQRPPLAARAQDIEDGSGALPIGDPGPPTTKTRRVLVLGHYRLEHGPEFIRDPVAGRHVTAQMVLGKIGKGSI